LSFGRFLSIKTLYLSLLTRGNGHQETFDIFS
jgi:hypothetical protein